MPRVQKVPLGTKEVWVLSGQKEIVGQEDHPAVFHQDKYHPSKLPEGILVSVEGPEHPEIPEILVSQDEEEEKGIKDFPEITEPKEKRESLVMTVPLGMQDLPVRWGVGGDVPGRSMTVLITAF